MKVCYYCHYGHLTGYGRAAHDYLRALQRYRPDVELCIHPLSAWDPQFEALERRYRPLSAAIVGARPHGQPDLVVVHTTPARLSEFTRRTDTPSVPHVGYTTWETFDLPADLSRALMAYEALVVPSEFCVQAFGEHDAAGVSLRDCVTVLPHCYDPEFWPIDQIGDRSITDENRHYRFYTIGAWGERKNQMGVIKAFLHAFTRADPVELVVSSENADINAVRSLLARCGIAEADWPRINVIDPARRLSEDELVDLHLGADCFVSATRGEGFGLGHFEAAIMGRGVITPMWGGHEEYLEPLMDHHDSQVHRVEYQLAPVFPEPRFTETVGGVAKMIVPAALGLSCKQAWADPDLLDLGNLMRRMTAQEHLHDDWATEARRKLAAHTYEPTAHRLATIFEEVRHG